MVLLLWFGMMVCITLVHNMYAKPQLLTLAKSKQQVCCGSGWYGDV